MVLPLQFLPPIVLGLMLAVSGALKMKSPGATVDAIRAFRLPRLFHARWVAYLLPFGEVILGLGLMLASGWLLRVIGVLASALLVVFTVLVGGVLRRKEDVSCNCFGSLSAARIEWPMLVRNVLLTMAALFVALGLDGSAGAVSALMAFSAADYVWLVVAATLAIWLIVVRWMSQNNESGGFEGPRSEGSLVADLSGRGIPELEFRDSELKVVKLRDVPRTKAQLLIFARPGCEACGPVIESLPTWREEIGSAVEIRVVTTHSHNSLAEAYPSEAASALYDGSSMGTTILGIPGVPSALLLGTNGLVGAGPAVGPDAVAALLEAVADAART